MAGKLLATGIAFCLMFMGIQATGATFENESLVIEDITGNLSSEKFAKLVSQVDSTLTKILHFWSASPGIKQHGKIIVEFDNPGQKMSYSIFFIKRESGQDMRVVRVTGGGINPCQLAHKLTHAVFPNHDKLIRNMMGLASEKRFGNPLSFPLCGFDDDSWVMALSQAGFYISLSKLGPDHRDWGMEIENNRPRIKDRVKQHAGYAEAGSFGEFLLAAYGIEKMKQFDLLSLDKSRPWEEVFGVGLDQLEAKWLGALRSSSRGKEEKISTLAKLLKDNPRRACFSAQDLSRGK